MKFNSRIFFKCREFILVDQKSHDGCQDFLYKISNFSFLYRYGMAISDVEKYTSELVNKLVALKPYEKVSGHADLKGYIGTNYEVIGLTVPTQRSLFKKGYPFSALSLSEQLLIFDGIWRLSDVYEVLSQCIYFVEQYWMKMDAAEVWSIVKFWVKKIDNWAHSDGLSDIYAHLMEKIPDEIYGQYLLWNTSENPWERRQSLVGMLLYSKKRKTLLPAVKLLNMVEPLIGDQDYFVQKGLGWALREIGNVYPDETLAFLNKHCIKLQPVAFTTAIEKIDLTTKNALKALRKQKK